MAIISTIAVAAALVRSLDTGVFAIQGKPVLPAAAQNDQITLFTAPHAMRVVYSVLKAPATLGAATLQLRKNSGGTITQMANTTTAGAVSVSTSHSVGPVDLAAGDTVELLVGAGALTSGQIEFDLLTQRP